MHRKDPAEPAGRVGRVAKLVALSGFPVEMPERDLTGTVGALIQMAWKIGAITRRAILRDLCPFLLVCPRMTAMKETEFQPPDLSTPEARHFWCFISYRHADDKDHGRQWASWLQQSIETYEVPRDLIGKRNERGDVIPERIYPVFRDEVELPADARLSKPIQGALERSRFLIVLCSPRARESRFVNEEIVFFQQHKAENRDRVLAAILAGDPGASDEDSAEEGFLPDFRRQCFPEPLRFEVGADGGRTGFASEPVAADFRLDDGKEGYTNTTALRDAFIESGLDRATVAAKVAAYEKRQELMILKIIAGILGVQLGELARRDKAHQLQKIRVRNRILTVAAIVFAGLAALAGWLGLVATQRGEEAKRETARAEDRERAAIRQSAQTLLVQGTRALAEQDVRGVCHLVESLKVCPEDNPALAALLTTLHFRRWAWPVAEGPVFKDVDLVDANEIVTFDDEGRLRLGAGDNEGESIRSWQMVNPGSWQKRYGSLETSAGEDNISIPSNDHGADDSGEGALWKAVCSISPDHFLSLNASSRHWAVWDHSLRVPKILMGPVPYTGDVEPLFGYNLNLGLLAVLSRESATRGEHISYSTHVTTKVYSLWDRFELGWNQKRYDQGHEAEGIEEGLQSDLKRLLRLDEFPYGDRVNFVPSPDGRLIAAGGVGRVWICQRFPLSVLHEVPLEWAYSLNGILMDWSPDSRFLMATAVEESMWFSPSVIDLQRVAPPVLLESIRVFAPPRFSADNFWALCPTEESVDLFDLPTRGTACHFRIQSGLSSELDMSSTLFAKETTNLLLGERIAPPWLCELALSLVGWRVDEGGGLVELSGQLEQLEGSLMSIRGAEDSPLTRWAQEWLVRFEGPTPIRRVEVFGEGLAENARETILKAIHLQKGTAYSADIIDEALKSAYLTGLCDEITIKTHRIWGGAGLEVEIVPAQ